MSSTSTFSNDLKELCAANDWPAAKALFDRSHGDGKMPLDKGSITTRRLLVDLMLHCQVEVPTAYLRRVSADHHLSNTELPEDRYSHAAR